MTVDTLYFFISNCVPADVVWRLSWSQREMRAVTILLFVQSALLLYGLEPESAWLVSTDSLPSHTSQSKFNPTLGNGLLAVTPYLEPGVSVPPSILVNCLYNGDSWTSHRARLPNYSNYLLDLQSSDGKALEMEERYSLDLAKAEFQASFNSTEFWVTHQVLVHRTLTRTIVNLVRAGPVTPSGSSLNIDIHLEVGDQSEDITNTGTQEMELPENTLGIDKIWWRCEHTTQVEFSSYQASPSPVCIAWVEPWFSGLVVSGNDVSEQERVFITIVDSSLEGLLEELDLVVSHTVPELLSLHHSAMTSLWSEGVLEVWGDLELARVVLASQYYLLSSLPSLHSVRPLPPFCGLSPGSLAYGLLGQDYQGHNFWDTETWMFPPVLLLHPVLARQLLDYRWSRVSQARDYAASTGWEGARFPWESAFTGGEVCPDWAAETRDHQHHITADVSLAVRQYLAVTGDVGLLTEQVGGVTGCQFVRDMAQFWRSRMSYNAATGQYDITEVMGPDEYHGTTDNNVYTNIVAAMSVNLANFTSCVAECEEVPQEWLDTARKLSLQYDEERDYHPQYEGYQPGTEIKQADTVLAGYPLMYAMNLSTRLNDLDMYESVTDVGGPAMTWGMYSIGYLELGQQEKAEDLFRRSYEPYYHKPFYMWTEAILGGGAANFITGMGGFLQALMFGYFGVRTHIDRINFDPTLPANIETMKLTGVNYQDVEFDVVVEEESLTVNFTRVGGSVLIFSDDDVLEVGAAQVVNLPRTQFYITPLHCDYLERCPLPVDIIGG